MINSFKLRSIDPFVAQKYSTGFGYFDKQLNGGVLQGSSTIMFGDTLMTDGSILYAICKNILKTSIDKNLFKNDPFLLLNRNGEYEIGSVKGNEVSEIIAKKKIDDTLIIERFSIAEYEEFINWHKRNKNNFDNFIKIKRTEELKAIYGIKYAYLTIFKFNNDLCKQGDEFRIVMS